MAQAATAIDRFGDRDLPVQPDPGGAFWPDISEFHKAWIARVASELDLDLLRDEVTWFQDRPYVTIKGLVPLINRHTQFDSYDLEPASEKLPKASRVCRDEEQMWVCRVWRKDRTRPAVADGRPPLRTPSLATDG